MSTDRHAESFDLLPIEGTKCETGRGGAERTKQASRPGAGGVGIAPQDGQNWKKVGVMIKEWSHFNMELLFLQLLK